MNVLTQLFTNKKPSPDSQPSTDLKPAEVQNPVEVKPPTVKTVRDLKRILKGIATEIQVKRPLFRNEQRTHVSHTVSIYELLGLSDDFRHKHIAYCELRGRTRDQIEKPHENNLPDENRIKEIKDEYGNPTQTLYPSAQ